jgi:hypothetical protein
MLRADDDTIHSELATIFSGISDVDRALLWSCALVGRKPSDARLAEPLARLNDLRQRVGEDARRGKTTLGARQGAEMS